MSIKQTILNLLEEEEPKKKTVALYGGGFKPPHKGHFSVVKEALAENPEIDEMVIYIGKRERDGITQEQSLKIWEIYKKHLPFKVTFEAVANPISSIYSYAKNHPEEQILWVIGAREGMDSDFHDINKRTSKITTRPNIKLITIISKETISGTAARGALTHSFEKFEPFLPDELSDDEKSEAFSIIQNQEITENLQDDDDIPKDLYDLARKYSVGLYTIIQNLLKGAKIELPNIGDEGSAMEHAFNMISKDLDYYNKANIEPVLESYKIEENKILPHIAPLTKFMEESGLIFKPYPKLKFIDDDVENGEDIFGTTAYFDPNNNTVVLYTYNRHPKDILRSYAHEMIHVYQNVEDRLNTISNTTNVNEDDELEKIEREAYETGNILFRKWTNSLNESLSEGKQVGLLYHFTNKQSLDKILTSNILMGSFMYELKNGEELYGVSTTRNKNLFYDKRKNDIRITLDGDKLSNNYKIQPRDYWYRQYNIPGEPQTIDEDEEVILTPKQQIPNIKNYIISVDKVGGLNESLDYSDLLSDTEKEALEIVNKNWSIFDGKECNKGFCDIFASKLQKRLPGSTIMHTEEGDIGFGHVWLEYKGKYYDAETPDGVDNWKELPWMIEFNEKNGKYPTDVENLNEEKEEKDILGLKAYTRELARLAENEGNWDIYVDMDGVIADFNARFEELAGMSPSDFESKYGGDEFWDFIDEKHKIKFWVGIPLMDGAKDLINFVKNYKYSILTAPSTKKQSLIGKSVWVKKKTGDLFPSKPKLLFKAAKNKHKIKPNLTEFDILIDDKQSTIDNWNEAGGTGIFYVSSQQVIKDLENLGL